MEFIAGDPKTALASPNSLVLTEAAAVKYFGHAAVMGETLQLDNDLDLTVTGVIRNHDSNTHLVDNFYSNIDALRTITGGGDFLDHPFSDVLYQYIRVAPGTDMAALIDKFNQYMTDNVDPRTSSFALVASQPLADIHFSPGLDNESDQTDTLTGLTRVYRPKSDIWIFITVAIVTLAVAAFNFMNLRIAQATARGKEVGIKKVLGASVGNIVSLLSWDFSKLVIVANLVAWPAAWYLMRGWLDGFAYRTEIGLLVFLVSGLAALAIALATIMYRAVKAARRNPIVCLRYE